MGRLPPKICSSRSLVRSFVSHINILLKLEDVVPAMGFYVHSSTSDTAAAAVLPDKYRILVFYYSCLMRLGVSFRI